MKFDANSEIAIPLSKGKITLIFLGSCGFVVLGSWLWSFADTLIGFQRLEVMVVAVVGVLFFGLCAIWGCIKISDGRPGLIIDDKGIVDYSSAVSAGRIPWEEISGLRVSDITGQRFLTVEVTDPQKYVEAGGYFRRKMNAANTRMTGSPINISSSALKVNLDDLISLMIEGLENHRAHHPGRRAHPGL
jgi:hypothetical protein